MDEVGAGEQPLTRVAWFEVGGEIKTSCTARSVDD
jgi:hypothetical protein